MRDSTALPFLLTRSYSVFAVRRLRGAAGRDDDARVAAFVRDVRGSLYSTIKDELKLSLQHHAQPVSVRAAPVAVGPPSDISSAARTLQPRVPARAAAERLLSSRYHDTDEDGLISESEWCAMCLVLQQAQRSLPQTAAPPLLPPTPCFGVVVAGA